MADRAEIDLGVLGTTRFSLAVTTEPWALDLDAIVVSVGQTLGSLGTALRRQLSDREWDAVDPATIRFGDPYVLELGPSSRPRPRYVILTTAHPRGQASSITPDSAAEASVAALRRYEGLIIKSGRIGIPLIGTGNIGLPVGQVAASVVPSLMRAVTPTAPAVAEIVFICNSDRDAESIERSWRQQLGRSMDHDSPAGSDESSVPPPQSAAPQSVPPQSDRPPSTSAPSVPTQTQTQPSEPAWQLAGYTNDAADGEDALDLRTEIDSLCTLLIAESVVPPLSVGLFGDWGSGKSFYMQKMRDRIRALSTEAAEDRNDGRSTPFCENVRQITFNAWHYADANLWASLMSAVLAGIAQPAEEQDERRRRNRGLTLSRLASARVQLQGVREQQRLAAAELAAAERQVARAREHEQGFASPAEAATAVLSDDTLRARAAGTVADLVRSAIARPADADNLQSLYNDVRGIATATGYLWRNATRSLRATWILLTLLLLGGIVLATPLVAGHHPLTKIAFAPGLLGLIGILAPKATQIRRAAEQLKRQVGEVADRESARAQQLVATAETKVDHAQAQQQALTHEIREIEAGHRILPFIQSRIASADYDAELGIIAMIRRDLEQLSRMMTDPDLDDDVERIGRIILYIDDLDRCAPDRVVEVLQAVHLLLAFPLFVVVVGVDSRWLIRSLELQYKEILDQAPAQKNGSDGTATMFATPQSYLEKIFQIPLSLRPMNPAGFARLVRLNAGQLVADDATSPASDGPPASTAAGIEPSDGVGPQPDEAPALPTTEVRIDPTSTPTGASLVTEFAASDVRQLLFPPVRRAVFISNAEGDVVSYSRLAGKEVRRIWTAPEPGRTVLAPNCEWALWAADSGDDVRLLDLTGQSPDQTVPTRGGVEWISIFAQGDHFVVKDAESTRRFPAGSTDADRIEVEFTGRFGDTAYGDFGGQWSRLWLVGRSAGSGTDDGRIPAWAIHGSSMVVWEPKDKRLSITTGRQGLRLDVGPTAPEAVTVSGTGRIAVALEDRIAVLDAHGTPTSWIQTSDRTALLEFNATARLLAAVTRGGSVQIWNVDSRTSRMAANLQLSEAEVAAIETLQPLLRTPRAVKRLINVYRLLRAPMSPAELDLLLGRGGEPDHPVVLLMLAIMHAHPDEGSDLIRPLTGAGYSDTWKDHVHACKDDDGQWPALLAALSRIGYANMPRSTDRYAEWADRVSRFSFRALARDGTRPLGHPSS